MTTHILRCEWIAVIPLGTNFRDVEHLQTSPAFLRSGGGRGTNDQVRILDS